MTEVRADHGIGRAKLFDLAVDPVNILLLQEPRRQLEDVIISDMTVSGAHDLRLSLIFAASREQQRHQAD